MFRCFTTRLVKVNVSHCVMICIYRSVVEIFSSKTDNILSSGKFLHCTFQLKIFLDLKNLLEECGFIQLTTLCVNTSFPL